MHAEKPKHILPKATHDLLISNLSNGLTVDAVVNTLMANGNVEKSRIDSVRFWANIYYTKPSKTERVPQVTNPPENDNTDEITDDATVVESVITLNSVNRLPLPSQTSGSPERETKQSFDWFAWYVLYPANRHRWW